MAFIHETIKIEKWRGQALRSFRLVGAAVRCISRSIIHSAAGPVQNFAKHSAFLQFITNAQERPMPQKVFSAEIMELLRTSPEVNILMRTILPNQRYASSHGSITSAFISKPCSYKTSPLSCWSSFSSLPCWLCVSPPRQETWLAVTSTIIKQESREKAIDLSFIEASF